MAVGAVAANPDRNVRLTSSIPTSSNDTVFGRNGLSPIDIFNNSVNGTSRPTAPSDPVLIANNAVVGSNPLEGLYVTGTVSPTVNRTPDNRTGLSSAIGFELYRNLGLRSEGSTAVEGAFDGSNLGLPTLMIRIKLGRIEELRALPAGVQESLVQYFAPMMISSTGGRLTFNDFLENLEEMQQQVLGRGSNQFGEISDPRRTLSLVIAVNTQDATNFAANFMRGEPDRLESAEIGLAFTQPLNGILPNAPNALLWANIRWRLTPGVGTTGEIPRDQWPVAPGVVDPARPDSNAPILPPGGTPTLRLGIELPKFYDNEIAGNSISLTGRLGTGTSIRIEPRPPGENGGPTIQLSDGRVVELPPSMLGLFDLFGTLTGVGTSADAVRNGVPQLEPPAGTEILSVGDWASDLGGDVLQQLTGQRNLDLSIPEELQNETNAIMRGIEGLGYAFGVVDALANSTPQSSILWSRFAQNRTWTNFRAGVISIIAPFLMSGGGVPNNQEVASYALGLLGLTEENVSRWTETQKDLFISGASIAWTERQAGRISDAEYLEAIVDTIGDVALLQPGSTTSVVNSNTIRVEDIVENSTPEFANLVVSRLLDNGADPILLGQSVLRVYGQNRDPENLAMRVIGPFLRLPSQQRITENASAIWNSSDPRLRVTNTILWNLFGDFGTPNFKTSIPEINRLIPDLSNLGQSIDNIRQYYRNSLGNAAGDAEFDRRILRLANQLLDMGYDLNFGSNSLAPVIRTLRNARQSQGDWQPSADAGSVRESFDQNRDGRLLISDRDDSLVASLDGAGGERNLEGVIGVVPGEQAPDGGNIDISEVFRLYQLLNDPNSELGTVKNPALDALLAYGDQQFTNLSIDPKYPPLKADQLINSLINFGSLFPGGVGNVTRDASKLYDIYKLGDALAKLVDGGAGAVNNPFDTNGSTEAENFVVAAADVIKWVLPETADEIAVAKQVYGLIDSAISIVKTPGQLAAIQANIIASVTQQAAAQGVTLTASQAEQLARATMPNAFNPTLLTAANWLSFVSVGLSFIKEDWAKIASTVTSIASTVLLISAGAINPVIGVIGIFASFLGGALGLSKPSTIPLGDFNATGAGDADDAVRYSIGKKDFIYNVDTDYQSLDIKEVSFRLHEVEVEPNMRDSGRDGRNRVQDGWRLADNDSDGGDRVAGRDNDRNGDNVTKYYLDASFTFDGLFGGATDDAIGRLPKFSVDDGDRDGPGTNRVTGFEITKQEYDLIKRMLGESGRISGQDERISILKDYVDNVQPVSFRQTENDQGLWFYTDVNGDGALDLVKQDINIEDYRDGDDSVDVTLFDVLGRKIVNFDAESLASKDLRDPMNKALAEVTVGPVEPIGLTQQIGPDYRVDLPAIFAAEGALTEDQIKAIGGLTEDNFLAAAFAGGNPPAWAQGWLPDSYEGIRNEAGGRLNGDDRANLLFGFNGTDRIWGGAGNDRIAGGAGDDQLQGGVGQDLLIGNNGSDILRGGKGEDVAYGGAGNDTLYGNTGDDSLFGGSGTDRIVGGSGNDLIQGGQNADRLIGGAGQDTLSYAESNRGVQVDLGRNIVRGGTANGDFISGFEGVIGGSGNDILRGDSLQVTEKNDELVFLSTGQNRLEGGAGRDRLFGLGGNDELSGGLGADVIDGGDGKDVASYVNSLKGVNVNLANGTVADRGSNEGPQGEARGDRLISIEGVFGSNQSDRLTGNAADNLLVGNGGNDRLVGGAGNDMLQGGEGSDVLRGGTGNDIASFGDLAPTATGLGITADLARQTVGGVAASDTIVSVEGVVGTAGIDVLQGSSGINRLDGLGGNDVIDGRGGNDKLYGGDGNDVLIDQSGENDLIGGRGDDRLIAGRGRDLLTGDEGNDLLRAGGGNDLLRGGSNNDTLIGGVGNDKLTGDAGNDVLIGGGGKDELYGGAGNDRLVAGRSDKVIGGAGRDTVVIDGRGGQFEVQKLGPNRYRLIDESRGRAGVIEVKDVERFQFSDGIYRINGRGDLVRVSDVPVADRNAGEVAPEVSASFADAARSIERTLDSFIAVQTQSNTVNSETNTAPTPSANTPAPPPSISFANQPEGVGVTVDLANGTATAAPAAGGNAENPVIAQPVVVAPEVVNVVGTQSPDQITGNSANNVLIGLAGQDRLSGGAGNDRLVGGAGADTLIGGVGNDRLIGGAGRDTIVLQGGAGRYDITKVNATTYRIRDTKTGTVDVARDVEFVRFFNGQGNPTRLASLVPK